MLQRIAIVPVIRTSADGKNLLAQAKEFTRLSGGLLTKLKEQSEKLEARIKELSTRIDQGDSQLQQHEQVIETQKGRLDKAISEFQGQFSQAEEQRRTQFVTEYQNQLQRNQSFREKIDSELKQFLAGKEEEFATQFKSFTSQGESAIANLEERKKEAAKLVQVITNIGVTGNYNKSAEADRKTANIFRGIALLFMIGIVIGALGTLWLAIGQGEFDWRITLFRMFTTATLAIPAFYAARESRIHRRMEQRYRKMELELASIDPFLEKLPEEKRYELKSILTERFFGQPEPPSDSQERVTAMGLFDLLKTMAQNLTKK